MMATFQDLKTTEHPQWCPGCLLPGSLIQKNPSIDKIENIAIGDGVLGSDGKYHKVTEIFVHNHKGKMYNVSSKCLGTTTLTEEHPMLSVRREHAKRHNKEFELNWTRTDQLKKGDYLAFPILNEIEAIEEIALALERKAMDRKSKELPPRVKINRDFLLFCGYYVAEGHVHKRELCFTFNLNEQQYIDDVVRISAEVFCLTASVKIREKKNTAEISIAHAPLARLFEEWFGNGAQNKRIPRFIMLLPKEKQKAFVQGMWRGDGWIGKGKATYKTISRTLCEQLKILLIRHQIVPVIGVNKAGGIHKESYTIHVGNRRDLAKLSLLIDTPITPRSEGKPPSSIILDGFVLTPISKITTFDYDGPVHNFEVEGVHSYVSENAALHNCGDFGILLALKQAIAQTGIDLKDIVLVSGIGCSGKISHYVKVYSFESIHGRVLPVATAIKLCNHNLTVIGASGDGDAYGIGLNHFIHAMRRNINITYVVHNNQVYGLTKGQTSPTSEKGYKSKSTPDGVLEEPINPLTLALDAGATYIARGFAGDTPHLVKLIVDGIKHKGFSLIDVFQPCIAFNQVNTFDFYKERCYKLEDAKHDVANFEAAHQKTRETEKLPIGLFYNVSKPTYEDGLPQIKDKPLVEQSLDGIDVLPLIKKKEI